MILVRDDLFCPVCRAYVPGNALSRATHAGRHITACGSDGKIQAFLIDKRLMAWIPLKPEAAGYKVIDLNQLDWKL